MVNSLKVKNLVLDVPTSGTQDESRSTILKGISANFEHGKINAIMGANGCGKTTFLNILYGYCDKKTKTSGEIFYNEETRDVKKWFDMVSYSEQQSYEIVGQTARSVIQFAIDMKNADSNTNAELKEFTWMFEELYIADVLDKNIEVLSGGERQRVLIAMELVMAKDILILDEPTSDLDSHLALNLIMFLKNLAKEKGVMVILTIHQPSDQIFQNFDNLLFMMNGKVVYDGEAEKLESYLASKSIIRPEEWPISEFIFEAFYSELSHFEEINALEGAVAVLKEEIDLKSDEILATSTLSNKIQDRYINTEISIRKALCLSKRQILSILKLKGTLFLFVFAPSFLLVLGLILDQLSITIKNNEVLKFREYYIEFFQKLGFSEDFSAHLTNHIFRYFMLAITFIFMITSFFDNLAVVKPDVSIQIRAEIQKNFYSAKTLFLSTFFTDIFSATFFFLVLLAITFATGIGHIIPSISLILIWILVTSLGISTRLLFNIFNSDRILIKILGIFKGYLHIFLMHIPFSSFILKLICSDPKINDYYLLIFAIKAILCFATIFQPAALIVFFLFQKKITDKIEISMVQEMPDKKEAIESSPESYDLTLDMLENTSLDVITDTEQQLFQNLKKLIINFINQGYLKIKVNTKERSLAAKSFFASPSCFIFSSTYFSKYFFILGLFFSLAIIITLNMRIYPRRLDPYISLKV